MSFFNSFIETALHSLWQSALIVLLYECINRCVRRIHPLQKRDLLYLLLATQVILSAITFTFYFTGGSVTELFSITSSIQSDTLLFSFFYNYSEFLFYGYSLIITYRFCTVWKQSAGFKKEFNKNLIRPAAELKVFTTLKAFQLGIKRKVTLRYSNLINVPLTFGFFKPVILLPFSIINHISIKEAESIIMHELAHIKSRDYLLNWLLIITDIIYFFNPFIKIVIAKIKAEREKNCDVQVINFEYNHLGYAQTLLKIARLSNGVKEFQLAAVHKKPELLQRIKFFSEKRNLVFNRFNAGSVGISCSLFIITAALLLLPNIDKKEKTIQPAPASSSPIVKQKNKLTQLMTGLKEKEKTPESFAAEFKVYQRNLRPVVKLDDHEQHIIETAPYEINIEAMPVAFNETQDSIKEFIYNEETQQGKITQSFKLILINGEWVMQPQWMILETKPDSTRSRLTDSIPPIQ